METTVFPVLMFSIGIQLLRSEGMKMRYDNTPRNLTFFNGSTSCEIANLLTIDETKNILVQDAHSISSNVTAWIGTLTQTGWMDFLGCIERFKENLTNVRMAPINTSYPVQECYKFCSLPSFSLSQDKCICFEGNGLHTAERKPKPYTLLKDIYKGKSGNILCTYKLSAKQLNSYEYKHSGDCMFAYKSDGSLHYGADVCLNIRKTLCLKFGKRLILLGGSENRTWPNSGLACQSKGLAYVSQHDLKENNNALSIMAADVRYWIGSFRATFPRFDKEFGKCLAAYVYKNGTVSSAFQHNCSAKLPSLCLVSETDNVTTGPKFDVSATSVLTSSTAESDAPTKLTESNNSTILLSCLVVAAVILLLLVCLLIFCCVKNKTTQKPKNVKLDSASETNRNIKPLENVEHQDSSDTMYHEIQEIQPPSNSNSKNYDNTCFSENTQENDYDVFCRKGKDLRSENSESNYDTTHAIRNQMMDEAYGTITVNPKNHESYSIHDINDYDTMASVANNATAQKLK